MYNFIQYKNIHSSSNVLLSMYFIMKFTKEIPANRITELSCNSGQSTT